MLSIVARGVHDALLGSPALFSNTMVYLVVFLLARNNCRSKVYNFGSKTLLFTKSRASEGGKMDRAYHRLAGLVVPSSFKS